MKKTVRISKLMDVTANNLESVQTNKVVTWKAILQQSAKEAKEASKNATKHCILKANIN